MAICCRVLQLGASRGNFNDYPKPFLVAPRLRRRSNIRLSCIAAPEGLGVKLAERSDSKFYDKGNVRSKRLLELLNSL
jgi:hypothetical protein